MVDYGSQVRFPSDAKKGGGPLIARVRKKEQLHSLSSPPSFSSVTYPVSRRLLLAGCIFVCMTTLWPSARLLRGSIRTARAQRPMHPLRVGGQCSISTRFYNQTPPPASTPTRPFFCTLRRYFQDRSFPPPPGAARPRQCRHHVDWGMAALLRPQAPNPNQDWALGLS